MKQELQKELIEIKQRFESIEKRIESMPDEKWRWVPKVGERYWYLDSCGEPSSEVCDNDEVDKARIARGNCYPTEQAAIEAREQQDFIREWQNAGDVAKDARGYVIAFDEKHPVISEWSFNYGLPKFTSTQKAREWVDSHGGPDVVRERLAMGWV